MAINYRLLDMLRRGRSEHENHLIDGLVRGDCQPPRVHALWLGAGPFCTLPRQRRRSRRL